MHYSWSTEARARRALANVSALLRPGGIFIGTMPDANVIIKKLREGFILSHDVYISHHALLETKIVFSTIPFVKLRCLSSNGNITDRLHWQVVWEDFKLYFTKVDMVEPCPGSKMWIGPTLNKKMRTLP